MQITKQPITGSPTAIDAPAGRREEAGSTSPVFAPGNPQLPGLAQLRRRSSTAAHFDRTFGRSAPAAQKDAVHRFLELSDALSREPVGPSGRNYLLGVKKLVGGKTSLQLHSDLLCEVDPHEAKIKPIMQGEAEPQEARRILHDILEARTAHPESRANMRLRETIQALDEGKLQRDALPKKVCETMAAVRLEDIEHAYAPEEGGEARASLQTAWEELQDAAHPFQDEEHVQQRLSEIAANVAEEGADLAPDALKSLLKDVAKCPRLPQKCDARDALNKVVTDEKELMSHCAVEIFQQLAGKLKKDLPASEAAPVERAASAPLPGKQKVPPLEKRTSLLSQGLSRRSSLLHEPMEPHETPQVLQEAANPHVARYYHKLDELFLLCEPAAGEDRPADAANPDRYRKELTEARDILVQYKSEDLMDRFRDHPAGLIARQLDLPEKSGEQEVVKRALGNISGQLRNGYLKACTQEHAQLLRQKTELQAAAAAPASTREEKIASGVARLKLQAMTEALSDFETQQKTQRADRIQKRTNSLLREFSFAFALEERKEQVVQRMAQEPAAKYEEELEAIDKALEARKDLDIYADRGVPL